MEPLENFHNLDPDLIMRIIHSSCQEPPCTQFYVFCEILARNVDSKKGIALAQNRHAIIWNFFSNFFIFGNSYNFL